MEVDFTLHPYRDDAHRAGVIHLWNLAFDHPGGHNDPALSIARKQAVDDGLFFVAFAGPGAGRVVGTIMAGYDGHRGWLYSVAVLPEYRLRGIGAALISHAEAALVERGCTKINLQVVAGNEAVVGFYEALGYVQEPRISMGKPMDA